MFVLFTDFGATGVYTGQMRAILQGRFPERPVVDACNDAPVCNPRAAAYLLSALVPFYPADTVWLTVVDPGVGTDRDGLIVTADGRRFVGPDNGLLSQVIARAREAECRRIEWRPDGMSASFHGRDWFSHAAVQLALGTGPAAGRVPAAALVGSDWPADLPEVIYVDHFGNLVTGLRAEAMGQAARLRIAGRTCGPARTFADVPAGEPFWYVNANGLVEVAANRARAETVLGTGIGSPVEPVV
jgi:S-adenosyl-L-methionine hydrolase (adenosine-forming)